jgi:hypothetical protein
MGPTRLCGDTDTYYTEIMCETVDWIELSHGVIIVNWPNFMTNVLNS